MIRRALYQSLITLGAAWASIGALDGPVRAQGPAAPADAYAPNVYGRNPQARPYGPAAGAPLAPTTPTRPESWPGGRGESPRVANLPRRETPAPSPSPAFPPLVISSGQTIELATILARVGPEVVQGVEVLPAIDEYLAQVVAEANPPPSKEEINKARERFVRQNLTQVVKTKLLVAEAKRNIAAENLPKLEERITEMFNKEQLKKLLDGAKVNSRAELDAKLRKYGSSIEAQKRVFYERNISSYWLHQQVKDEEEISHEEMLAYYRDHLAEYESPAQAKWEHLLVKIDSPSTKAEAYAKLAALGNQVLSGRPLADIAKTESDDASGSDGGLHDWTTKGSLVSAVIDNAIFSLPVGTLSQILEDQRGFHIVRVVDLKKQTRKPFTEAQGEIKKKIRDEKSESQMKAYLAKLEEKTKVWTIFDEPAGGESEPQSAGRPNAQPRR